MFPIQVFLDPQMVNLDTQSCTTVPCVCNTAVAAGVQACVNCAISDDPTPTIISDAEGVINGQFALFSFLVFIKP